MFKTRIRQVYQVIRWVTMILSFVSIGSLIYDIGFKHPEFHVLTSIYELYLVTFILNIVAVLFRYLFSWYRPPRKLWFFDGILLRSEEHTSELQSRENLVCRLLLEKK